MAILDETARADVWAKLMRRYSNDGDSIGINKSDLRLAVNALDDFMNTHATDINNALPQPARDSLTSAQKATMLSFVVLKRYEVI